MRSRQIAAPPTMSPRRAARTHQTPSEDRPVDANGTPGTRSPDTQHPIDSSRSPPCPLQQIMSLGACGRSVGRARAVRRPDFRGLRSPSSECSHAISCGCVLGPAACSFSRLDRRCGHTDHSHGGDVRAHPHQQVAGCPCGVFDGGQGEPERGVFS